MCRDHGQFRRVGRGPSWRRCWNGIAAWQVPDLADPALTAVVLLGFFGAPWLSAEADKQFDKATAAMTARASASLVAEHRSGLPRHRRRMPDFEQQVRELEKSIGNVRPDESYDRAMGLQESVSKWNEAR